MGVVNIVNTGNKWDIIRIVDSMILHQQIERRNGMTFMRMKKRDSLVIR